MTALTPEEFSWFFVRPPICKCGVKMTLIEVGLPHDSIRYYMCFQCNIRVNLLAAGADVRRLNNFEKHRIKLS
jgi:hypothetical protein